MLTRTMLAKQPLLCTLALVICCLACEVRRPDPLLLPSATEPSPNASILPAPLAAGPPKAPSREAIHSLSLDGGSDAGVPEPPYPIREDEALSPEAELRAAPGLGLEARFRWLEPVPARPADGNAEVLARARDKTAFELGVELSSLGRISARFNSHSYSLPAGAELRAREDRYGHLLVWPNGRTYTPLSPGTLRAVLSDARLDVTPLGDPNVSLLGPGAVLGFATQRQAFETSVGRVELDQAYMPPLAGAGTLLCRLLLELLAVSPESPGCKPDWVPLRADYAWPSGAHFGFEVTKVTKRAELATELLSTPPTNAEARRGELPGTPLVALIDERELGDFRTRGLPPADKPDVAAPKAGLAVLNRSDSPRYLLIDGVPIVWLRPATEWLVTGLKPGRYNVQARNFFGADASPLRGIELPARFLIGDEDTQRQPN